MEYYRDDQIQLVLNIPPLSLITGGPNPVSGNVLFKVHLRLQPARASHSDKIGSKTNACVITILLEN